MKVRCDRKSLVESLTSIVGIVPPNSPKAILSDFYLGTDAGSLVVEASDLEISGTAVIHKVEVESDGAVALPSARLILILKEFPDEDLGSIPAHTPLPRLSSTPAKIRTPAPRLGEHTQQIQKEINEEFNPPGK